VSRIAKSFEEASILDLWVTFSDRNGREDIGLVVEPNTQRFFDFDVKHIPGTKEQKMGRQMQYHSEDAHGRTTTMRTRMM
jgi:hypothetical protein